MQHYLIISENKALDMFYTSIPCENYKENY